MSFLDLLSCFDVCTKNAIRIVLTGGKNDDLYQQEDRLPVLYYIIINSLVIRACSVTPLHVTGYFPEKRNNELAYRVIN